MMLCQKMSLPAKALLPYHLVRVLQLTVVAPIAIPAANLVSNR